MCVWNYHCGNTRIDTRFIVNLSELIGSGSGFLKCYGPRVTVSPSLMAMEEEEEAEEEAEEECG